MSIQGNSFDKIAESYDMWFQTPIGACLDNQEKDAVDDALKGAGKGSLLDLGCGTGHWSRYFHYKGFEVIGVDNSEGMLKVAKQKSSREIYYQTGNMEKLDFEDETFDITSAITSLEFTDNPQKALDEMWRVTKPGGRIILGVLNKYSLFGLLRKSRKNINVFTNARFYGYVELKEILSRYGRNRVTGSAFCLPWEWALPYADIFEEAGRIFVPFLGSFLVGVVFKYKY